MSDNSQRSKVANEVMEHFVLPMREGILIDELKLAIQKASSTLKDSAQAFAHNIDAAISTVSVPATLAMASAQNFRFQQLHIAEKIRAIPHEGEFSEEAKHVALENAKRKTMEELSTKTGVNQVATMACNFLLFTLEDEDVAQAALELTLQGTVLVWGAFEVLAREIFVSYLNSHPAEVSRLISNSEAQRLFQIKNMDLNLLVEHGFDLTEKMGTILSTAHELTNLPALKIAFGALFPNADSLHELLNKKEFWILSQRRHLIVHRRAIIDQKYVEKTGETQKVGTRLTVSPNLLMSYFNLVQRLGAALLTVASGQQPISHSSEQATRPPTAE